MKLLTIPTLTLAAGLGAAFPATAADWTQYRGPNTAGISTEKILQRWPEAGPQRVWAAETPAGFSSLVIGGGRAFTLVMREVDGASRELCLALDAATGQQLWATPLAMAKYQGGGDSGTPDNKGGDGPRATPAVDGDRVYVLDARLGLTCLEAASGKTIWAKDIAKEHSAKMISWQNAASPVIEGNLIFAACGGAGQSLLGIDKHDGKTVWKGQDDAFTHATPTLATIHGVRQAIFFTQTGLVSVAPKTGDVLWRHPFPFRVSTAASPIVAGDIVYCSAGYGIGAGAAKISKTGDKFSASELWRKPGDKPLANHWSTPVYQDGHLYGMFSFKEYGSGPLKCVELATGKEVWSKPGFGAGNVILVDGKVLVLGDDGQLVLVEASPKGYRELSRADVLDGKCWSTPAFSNGRVFARSTTKAVCLDLAVKTATR